MKHNFKIFSMISLIMLTLLGCTTAEQATPAPEQNADANFGAVISATGIVVPEQWAALSVRAPGVVDEVLVAEGQHVKQGELLLRLGNRAAAQAEVARAQENLIIAERALNSSSANALKDLNDAYEALRSAQNSIDNFHVPHDFSGMTPAEALQVSREKLDKARANFEPYKYLEERLEWEMRNNDPENPKVYRDAAKIYKKQLDNAWGDFRQAIRWTDLTAALQQAEAQLDNAQKEFNAVSAAQGTSLAHAQYLAAQSNLSAAQAALANMELAAPFDGVVCNLNIRVGEWATPGIPIIQLGDLKRLRIETTDLSEIDAARVHPNDIASITFDALPDANLKGAIARVANKSSESSGVNYTVIITLDSQPQELRWGMTAFVDIKVTP